MIGFKMKRNYVKWMTWIIWQVYLTSNKGESIFVDHKPNVGTEKRKIQCN